MPKRHQWAIIAHGGAKDIEPEEESANRTGLVQAIEAGSQMLLKGAPALEVVEQVVKMLESDPAYNAGLYGCARNEVGETELTASIMDGATLQIGAVAGIQSMEHPVSIARALLQDKAIFLIGEGAMQFAYKAGFKKAKAPDGSAAGSHHCDTVGCVALDLNSNLAVATSTAGLTGSRVGRVGDVPLPGCGFYADNNRGAISCSGEGEAIARVMLAAECLHLFQTHSANEAAEQAVALMDKVDGEAGIIGITHEGHLTWAHNSSNFAVGMAWEESPEPKVYLKKGEHFV